MTSDSFKRRLRKIRYSTQAEISDLIQAYLASNLPPHDFVKGRGMSSQRFKEVLEQYGISFVKEHLELHEIVEIIKKYTEIYSASKKKKYLEKLGIKPFTFFKWRKNFLVFRNSNMDIKVILINEDWEIAQRAKKKEEQYNNK